MGDTDDRDMGHMDHLEAVAAADVAFVRMREATYRGSWKRGGGRSAWFMLRRKIDRLLVMMSRSESSTTLVRKVLGDITESLGRGEKVSEPNIAVLKKLRDELTSEDIFAKVEEDPSGADGSPLAEVRDLRRYLLLVEAEMVSRGVVAFDGGDGEWVTPKPEASPPPAAARQVDIVFDGPPGPQSGRFVEVEDEQGRSFKLGDWVKREDGYWVLRFRAVLERSTGKDPLFEAPFQGGTSGTLTNKIEDWYTGRKSGEPPAVVQTDVRPQARVPELPDVVADLAIAWGVPHRDARQRLMRIANLNGAIDTVDAALSVVQYKWRLDRAGTLAELRKVRWSGADPVPRTDSSRHTVPPEPPHCVLVMDGERVAEYIAVGLHYLPVPGTDHAVVDRRQHPEITHLPRLAQELTPMEHGETLLEYRWMYYLSDGKYRLQGAFQEHWGEEP